MDDLISRAAAHEMVKGLQKWCITLPGNPRKTQVGCMSDDVRFGLDRLPAMDAVPVIRCRDCKYYAINRLTKAYEPDKRFNPSVCIIGEFARPRKPDWYCADGERRDDE